MTANELLLRRVEGAPLGGGRATTARPWAALLPRPTGWAGANLMAALLAAPGYGHAALPH